MNDSIQAMLVALVAVVMGIILDQFGALSVFFGLVGKMLIMGAFIIGVTAFLLFVKEWIFE
ncbi:MAG: hypothetical protein GYA23_07470 [Methanomicrobiales archaeon]|nr:hypothetical protein [Methanomicrobiales archaeon]